MMKEQEAMSTEELERKIAFHEKRMHDRSIPRYWRKKSEEMYWHYLELATGGQ